MKHLVTNPRAHGPHLRTAMDYLAALGATDVRVTAKRHLRVTWAFRGRAMDITLSSTPSDPPACGQVARQLIRRRFREAGFVAGAMGFNVRRVLPPVPAAAV